MSGRFYFNQNYDFNQINKSSDNYSGNNDLNIPNYNYRKVLIEIVLKNPKMIPISKPFFSVIINKIIDTEIVSISDNIKNLKNSNNIDYIEKINETKNDVLNDIGINEIKLDNQENGIKDIEIFKKTDKNIDNLDKIKSKSLRIKKIKLDGNKNSKRKSENIIKKKSFDEIKKEISEQHIKKDSTEKTKSHLIKIE